MDLHLARRGRDDAEGDAAVRVYLVRLQLGRLGEGERGEEKRDESKDTAHG
jgi:hypothetical protein